MAKFVFWIMVGLLLGLISGTTAAAHSEGGFGSGRMPAWSMTNDGEVDGYRGELKIPRSIEVNRHGRKPMSGIRVEAEVIPAFGDFRTK